MPSHVLPRVDAEGLQGAGGAAREPVDHGVRQDHIVDDHRRLGRELLGSF
jgi:hypothetical protein